MGRIKQGLDYFPMNTDFVNDLTVRRVMKSEGDSALTILLYTLSYLYAGEGYYLAADDAFMNELSDRLFTTDNEAVCRVIRQLVEYGFFDSALYQRYGILTSADIQRQYLFVVKRRKNRRCIRQEYCLIPDEVALELSAGVAAQTAVADSSSVAASLPENTGADASEIEKSAHETPVSSLPESHAADATLWNIPSVALRDDVYRIPQYVYRNLEKDTFSGTKCSLNDTNATKKRKGKDRKENILPNPPCEGGDEEGGKFLSQRKKACELTQEDIDRMQFPADGCPRNFSGLLENLRLYRIPPAEQYAIVLKSNYGEIGGKVWQALCTLRSSNGKIKLPGHYLLSVLGKRA